MVIPTPISMHTEKDILPDKLPGGSNLFRKIEYMLST